MKGIFFILFVFALSSCNQGGGSASSQDFEAYTKEDLAGTSAYIASIGDLAANNYQKGIVHNGNKNGIWLEYHNNGRIKTLSNYVDGKMNLIKLTFNNRGQIEKKEELKNGEYHGLVAEYKFGRTVVERSYKNGVLDGPFTEYSDRGKIQKKGSFANGKQDGKLTFYDDDENVIMEYVYKNGEKVSGGIVEKPTTTEE